MNKYLVSGTRNHTNGSTDSFQIELELPSSREAYIKVRDDSYNEGYRTVNVVAIKMECPCCGECHMIVPPNLYLD